MFLVKAKTTTVVIGTWVFSPVLASRFEHELQPDVAERGDLLLIEEVLDEEPVVAPGGLTATGTLETDPGSAGTAGEGGTGAGGAPAGEGQEGGEAGTPRVNPLTVDSDGDGHGAIGPDGRPSPHHGKAGTGAGGAPDGAGPETDPTLLTDKTLTEGVTLLHVGGDDDDGPGADPDPFADTSEGSGTLDAGAPDPAQAPPAPAPAPSAPATIKGGRGNRNSRK